MTLGMATVTGGAATLTTTALSVGVHQITAVYSGDSRLAGATSPPLTQTISGQAAWTLAKTTSPATFTASGETLTANYVVSNTGGVGIGTITITDTRVTNVSCPATSSPPAHR